MIRIGEQIAVHHSLGWETATIIAIDQQADGTRYTVEYHDGQRAYLTDTDIKENTR